MSEIRPEPRVVRPILSTPKEPYWNFWRVLAVIVVAFVVIPWILAVSCISASTRAVEQATEKLARENNQSVARMQAEAKRLTDPRGGIVRLPPQRYVESVVVPGKTIGECNQLTGGIINEQWQKCRKGYKTTKEVWR